MPNAFSPDANGSNDVFRAKAFGEFVFFRLAVYNRYVQPVFMSADRFRGWDGSFRGKAQDADIYVYVCEYEVRGEGRVVRKGEVVLGR